MELKGDEVFSAIIELQIKLLAHNKAFVSVFLETLDKSESEKDELLQMFNQEYNRLSREILANLNTRRGTIDFNKLFNS